MENRIETTEENLDKFTSKLRELAQNLKDWNIDEISISFTDYDWADFVIQNLITIEEAGFYIMPTGYEDRSSNSLYIIRNNPELLATKLFDGLMSVEAIKELDNEAGSRFFLEIKENLLEYGLITYSLSDFIEVCGLKPTDGVVHHSIGGHGYLLFYTNTQKEKCIFMRRNMLKKFGLALDEEFTLKPETLEKIGVVQYLNEGKIEIRLYHKEDETDSALHYRLLLKE